MSTLITPEWENGQVDFEALAALLENENVYVISDEASFKVDQWWVFVGDSNDVDIEKDSKSVVINTEEELATFLKDELSFSLSEGKTEPKFDWFITTEGNNDDWFKTACDAHKKKDVHKKLKIIDEEAIIECQQYLKKVFFMNVDEYAIPFVYHVDDEIYYYAFSEIEEYDLVKYPDHIIAKLTKRIGRTNSNIKIKYLTKKHNKHCRKVPDDFTCKVSVKKCAELCYETRKNYKEFRRNNSGRVTFITDYKPSYKKLFQGLSWAEDIFSLDLNWDESFGDRRIPGFETNYFMNQPTYLITGFVDEKVATVSIIVERENYLSISLKADMVKTFKGIGHASNLEYFSLALKLNKPIDFLNGPDFDYKLKFGDNKEQIYGC